MHRPEIAIPPDQEAWHKFQKVVNVAMRQIEYFVREAPEQATAYTSVSVDEVRRGYNKFKENINRAIQSNYGLKDSALQQIWREFDSSGSDAAIGRVKFQFYDSIISRNYSAETWKYMLKLADCRFPSEWYPATRAIHRKIHLHVGPTNSGKTYHALQRLEQAESGIFAGPLRLLAHEVYTRLNAKGKLCSLVTGEEQRIPEGLQKTMTSCTVEMCL